MTTENPILTEGQVKIEEFLKTKGFSKDQINALFDAGFVYGPEDVGCVLTKELTSSEKFTPKDARRLFQFFGPKNLKKNFGIE